MSRCFRSSVIKRETANLSLLPLRPADISTRIPRIGSAFIGAIKNEQSHWAESLLPVNAMALNMSCAMPIGSSLLLSTMKLSFFPLNCNSDNPISCCSSGVRCLSPSFSRSLSTWVSSIRLLPLSLSVSSRSLADSLPLTEARSLARSAWRWAAANCILLKSWSHPSARDTSPSNIPSPLTPTSSTIHPIVETLFAHRSRRCVGRSIPIGRQRRAHLNIKITSASSQTTPSMTSTVEISSQSKNALRRSCRLLLVASSSNCRSEVPTFNPQTTAIVRFMWFLAIMGLLQLFIIVFIIYAAILSRRSSTSHAATKSDTALAYTNDLHSSTCISSHFRLRNTRSW
jgi:hypothetical protein